MLRLKVIIELKFVWLGSLFHMLLGSPRCHRGESLYCRWLLIWYVSEHNCRTFAAQWRQQSGPELVHSPHTTGWAEKKLDRFWMLITFWPTLYTGSALPFDPNLPQTCSQGTCRKYKTIENVSLTSNPIHAAKSRAYIQARQFLGSAWPVAARTTKTKGRQTNWLRRPAIGRPSKTCQPTVAPTWRRMQSSQHRTPGASICSAISHRHPAIQIMSPIVWLM